MEKKQLARVQILQLIAEIEQELQALETEQKTRNAPRIAELKEARRKWQVLIELTLPDKN